MNHKTTKILPKATAELQREVAEELKIPDPPQEVARAIFTGEEVEDKKKDK